MSSRISTCSYTNHINLTSQIQILLELSKPTNKNYTAMNANEEIPQEQERLSIAMLPASLRPSARALAVRPIESLRGAG